MFWGDKADLISNLIVDSIYTFSINIESREWNEKWFTDVKCFKVNSDERSYAKPNEQQYPEPGQLPIESDGSDLPF